MSEEEFCNRVAYHMGLPEDQYKRITYTKLGIVTRIDFDGGSPELNQNSCFIKLTEEIARNLGHTFSTMHQRKEKRMDCGVGVAEVK